MTIDQSDIDALHATFIDLLASVNRRTMPQCKQRFCEAIDTLSEAILLNPAKQVLMGEWPIVMEIGWLALRLGGRSPIETDSAEGITAIAFMPPVSGANCRITLLKESADDLTLCEWSQEQRQFAASVLRKWKPWAANQSGKARKVPDDEANRHWAVWMIFSESIAYLQDSERVQPSEIEYSEPMTMKKAAKLLGVRTAKTVTRWRTSKKIEAEMVGGRQIRISLADLEKYATK